MFSIKSLGLLFSLLLLFGCNGGGGGGGEAVPMPAPNPAPVDSFVGETFLSTNVTYFVKDNTGKFIYSVAQAGADPRGLYISTDGGTTYARKGAADGMAEDAVSRFASRDNIIIVDHQTINAASISTDSGNSFSVISGNLNSNDEYMYYIDSVGVIYAQGFSGLERSTDNGVSFTSISNVTSGVGPSLFIDHNDKIFYYSGNKIYKSTDKGTSWTTITVMPNKRAGLIDSLVVTSDDHIYLTFLKQAMMGQIRPLGGIVASFNQGAHFQYLKTPFEFHKLSQDSTGALCGQVQKDQGPNFDINYKGVYCSRDLTSWKRVAGESTYNFWDGGNLYLTLYGSAVYKWSGTLPSDVATYSTEQHVVGKLLSELPAGSYTRRHGVIVTRSGTVALKTTSTGNNVTLDSFSGDTNKSLSSTLDEYNSFVIAGNLDITFTDAKRTLSQMDFGFDFSNSSVTNIIGVTSLTRAEVLTAEATTVDYWDDYTWLDANTLEKLRSFRMGNAANAFFFQVSTIYDYVP